LALSSVPVDPESKAQGRASKARINLERTAILLIDNPLGLDILSHIFYGYGARQVFKCATAEEAMRIVNERELDLIVTEALLPDQDAYDFVRAIRGLSEQVNNRFTPVMVLSAHTAVSKVTNARDCGANFFLAKPISPRTVMERLVWVARESRQFLQSDNYTGPDRRFQELGPPPGVRGRRRGDDQVGPEAGEGGGGAEQGS
jgi:PleD family two-component response regulator